MKSSVESAKENSLKDEEISNGGVVAPNGTSCIDQKECDETKTLEEMPPQIVTNGNNVANGHQKMAHDKTDSLDSDSYDAGRQPTKLRTEVICSESETSTCKDGSVSNEAPESYHSSSANEDSCDGFNNNNKVVSNHSSPLSEVTNDRDPDGVSQLQNVDDAPVDLPATNSDNSTNRRKGSSRKSQPVRKVVYEEPGEDSDYYDSDLEEYFTPIIPKADKKPEDPQQKRRTSKRKRKMHLNIDEDSDYFSIENFLNSNPDEVQLMQLPKEKKKKKKGEGCTHPESPNTAAAKTMQNVKLDLPNGMTRVVSLEMPSPGSDSNSMLCSLLTGKCYSSPVKSAKLKLVTKDNSAASPGNDGEQSKRVRFSEQNSSNMVPKTVDDHCVSSKDDRIGGNVPLILENLLTSPHIDQSRNLSDEVPAVVEHEVLDLSNPDDTDRLPNARKSALGRIRKRAMQRVAEGYMSDSHNLNESTLDDFSAQGKDVESAEKGFSKTLFSYLTSGKPATDSQEFGGITVAPRENAAIENSASLTSKGAKASRGGLQQSLSALSNMYYAKSEYIDLNELYCLQKGKRPIFEIEDSDNDNDVIIISDRAPPKQDTSQRKNIMSSKKRKLLSNSGRMNLPRAVLPGTKASISQESIQAAKNHSSKNSDTKSKCVDPSPNSSMNKNKLIPQPKDAIDHSMKDGLIESISFTVSKLDTSSSPSKPVQLKSLLSKNKAKGIKKPCAVPKEFSAQPTVNQKNKAKAMSLLKSKSPPSSSQVKCPSKRIYNSLLTGNTYVMKDSNPIRLSEKQSMV